MAAQGHFESDRIDDWNRIVNSLTSDRGCPKPDERYRDFYRAIHGSVRSLRVAIQWLLKEAVHRQGKDGEKE